MVGQATSHYLNQWWLFYWRIYASLGLNEFNILQDLISHLEWYCVIIESKFTIFNSLVPGRCGSKFKSVISEHMLWIYKFMNTSCKIALGWMPQNFYDDNSTFVQVMAWCHQAPSHYISGLVQERCNSNALAMELRLSCVNPLTWANADPDLCPYIVSLGHNELITTETLINHVKHYTSWWRSTEGTRASADAVMTKTRSNIYIYIYIHDWH